ELEAALGVEDEVVRSVDVVVGGSPVQHLRLAGTEVDALDPAALEVRGLARRSDRLPVEPAVVADVGGAVRPDGSAVRATAELGDDVDLPVRVDAAQGAATELHDEERAVGQHDGSF